MNKDKVDYLISKNLMKEAGYKSIEIAKNNGSWSILDSVEALILPKDLKEKLSKRVNALEYYESLSKSGKKTLLAWMALAKKDETRKKRMLEIAENASKKLKPKKFR